MTDLAGIGVTDLDGVGVANRGRFGVTDRVGVGVTVRAGVVVPDGAIGRNDVGPPSHRWAGCDEPFLNSDSSSPWKKLTDWPDRFDRIAVKGAWLMSNSVMLMSPSKTAQKEMYSRAKDSESHLLQ